MKWVTREGARVDRVACPWLIKRFIDPNAQFLFVPANKVLEVSSKEVRLRLTPEVWSLTTGKISALLR